MNSPVNNPTNAYTVPSVSIATARTDVSSKPTFINAQPSKNQTIESYHYALGEDG